MSDSNDSTNSDIILEVPIKYPEIMGLPVIYLNDCVLYAPSSNGPPPTTREKPPGCKTVFVGGLPENATEDLMSELFGMVGKISTIRMSVKNFCHIRFSKELFVDRAIEFSGYRMKIDDKDDAPNTGRLHIDYALARDDQFEYDCRHRAEVEDIEKVDISNSPPPPALPPYSDKEAIALSAKLRNHETFHAANSVLLSWLEGGVCSKKNASFFYSMIQSSVNHAHHFQTEKVKQESLLSQAKCKLEDDVRNILLQFEEINKVFVAASAQKVWDHLTKLQRRVTLIWKDELEHIKTEYSNDISVERIEDDMDFSDLENNINESEIPDSSSDAVSVNEIEKLRQENDILRCQLTKSQKEVVLARSTLEAERADKEKQIKLICQNMQDVYKSIMSGSENGSDDGNESSAKRLERVSDTNESSCDSSIQECSSSSNVVTSSSGCSFSTTYMEARYLGLVSTFLSAHPFGANIDYICSYLNQFHCTLHARDLELLLEKFPIIFMKRSTGLGATLEKKWCFCGFESEL